MNFGDRYTRTLILRDGEAWQNALLEVMASTAGLQRAELRRYYAMYDWAYNLIKLRQLKQIILLDTQPRQRSFGSRLSNAFLTLVVSSRFLPARTRSTGVSRFARTAGNFSIM